MGGGGYNKDEGGDGGVKEEEKKKLFYKATIIKECLYVCVCVCLCGVLRAPRYIGKLKLLGYNHLLLLNPCERR